MPSSSRPGVKHPSVVLATLAFTCLVVALLQSLVSPAIGAIATALHSSPGDAAWASTGFLLSLGVCTSIVGRLGDIHGKRKVLIATLVIVLVGTLLSALATTLWLFVLGRVIQGVAGGLFPLAFGVIRDELPRERVPGAIGLISAILGLGSGIGVVMAGVIVDHLSVHWLFWFPLMGIVLGLTSVLLAVPESPVRAQSRINWVGAALMAGGLAAILLAVSRTSAWGWGSPKTMVLALAGALLLVAWVFSENRSPTPLVDMRMMRQGTIWPVNLLALALGFGLFAALLLIPAYAESAVGFGDSITAGSLHVLPLSIVMLIVGPFAGRLEARYGGKIPALAGAMAFLIGFVVLACAHGSSAPVLLASALLGLGIGLAFAAMANLIVQSVDPSETGVATGVNTVARTVGGAIGGQIAVTLVTSGAIAGVPTMDGFEHAFLLMVGAAVVAVLASTLIPALKTRSQGRETVPEDAVALKR
jgi:MFS family permease